MKCTNQNCQYEWKAKTKAPKSCPRCRQYLKPRNLADVLERQPYCEYKVRHDVLNILGLESKSATDKRI